MLAASDHAELVVLPALLGRIGKAAPGVRIEVLPWGLHEVPPALAYLKGLAQALPGTGRAAMTMLQDERTAGTVLDVALRKPEVRRPLLAALTNTATPTVLRAGGLRGKRLP